MSFSSNSFTQQKFLFSKNRIFSFQESRKTPQKSPARVNLSQSFYQKDIVWLNSPKIKKSMTVECWKETLRLFSVSQKY